MLHYIRIKSIITSTVIGNFYLTIYCCQNICVCIYTHIHINFLYFYSSKFYKLLIKGYYWALFNISNIRNF